MTIFRHVTAVFRPELGRDGLGRPSVQVVGDVMVCHPLVPADECRPGGILDDGTLVVVAGKAADRV